MSNKIEQKYILTNDALCYSLLGKKEFTKQLLLEKDRSENEKKEYINTIEKFLTDLKKALNNAYNLNL